CALAIKKEDGGPVFYVQERIGRGGKPFNIYKFRSMRTDAEASGSPALYSGTEDPRLTRTGRFLRTHHLDELPQLWNVLKGDMSFIGYRPERQFFIDQIKHYNPRYDYLFQIRPGVTSYATLYNGYTDTIDKMLTRLDLDLYYLRNHTVWFDMKVLGLTFLSIVTGKKF
ncbi:MAG: sugar transferase, partial [Bacteroidales bacterium]|nr:sugar transferase [Bacteroidales bacterium]